MTRKATVFIFCFLLIILLTSILLWIRSGSEVTQIENSVDADSSTFLIADKDNYQEHPPLLKETVKGELSENLSAAKNDADALIETPESVLSRQQYFDWLKEQSPEFLWSRFEELLTLSPDALTWDEEGDLEMTVGALAYQLQQNGGQEVYESIGARLRDETLAQYQSATIINLLEEIATVESTTIILDELLSNRDENLKLALLNGLGEIPNNLWDGRYHTEISPVLESAFANSSDTEIQRSVTLAIAQIGAPRGVQILLQSVENGTHKNTVTPDLFSRHITNEDAVPVLANAFTEHSSDLDHPVFLASGDALATIADKNSAITLVEWALQAPDDAASQTRKWFIKLSLQADDSAIDYIRTTLEQNSFSSYLVEEAVFAALD